jgi:EpsI family protein
VNPLLRWTPATLLAVAAVFTVGIDTHRSMPLRASLDSSIPTGIAGYEATDVGLTSGELAVAAPSAYVNRTYKSRDSVVGGTFSLYIAYYDQQTQGKTIHSPKNCLPGSGWEPVKSELTAVHTPSGPQIVNRYLLQGRSQRALVLYWYQGRGRIQADEYRVKFELLRDAAFRQRSDEALVRIVVPLVSDEQAALSLARHVARLVIPALHGALPL